MTLNFIKSSKAKSNLTAALLALALFLIGLNFQNCSSAKSDYEGSASGGVGGLKDVPIVDPDDDDDDDDDNNNDDDDSTESGSGYEPGSVTATFTAGDRYQGEVLVSSNSFLDTMISTYDYRNYSFSKAIAVAENGLGYMSLSDVDDTHEAKRMAIESCNLLANLPCALIVSENTFVIDSDEISDNLEYTIGDLTGRSFDRNAIPMTTNSVRSSSLITDYINAGVEKALAISITGGVYAAYSHLYQLSRQEVERMSVQQCELQTAISPCILFAVNDKVVFDPEDWVKKTRLVFNNENVMAFPPPAARDGALTKIRELLDSVDKNEKYSIVITANGFGFFGKGSTIKTATEKAVSNCENGNHGSRCIEYADNEGVKFSVDDTQAKSKRSSLFCKSVRYSCSDHKAVGCGSGTYWVQSSRNLAAEVANCR